MDDVQKNVTALVSRLGSTVGRAGTGSNVPSARTGTNAPSSLLNVFVYSVRGSVRSSVRSNRSQMSSIFSRRKSFSERTGFTFKQWLFLVFEMFLSFVWWVIEQRWTQIGDLKRRGLTERQALVDFYLRRACGSFISLLAGYLGDTYFNMYAMALFNVALYFLTSIILYMEVMIRFGDYDLYEEFFFQSVGTLLIPLKATDFTRLVYALQNIGRKKVKLILLFIFFTVWLNERAVGGFFVTIMSLVELSWENNIRISFLFSGATLAMYIYAFKPPKDKFEIDHGPVGNHFIGCVVTAIWTRARLKAYLTEKTQNWLDYAEIKYEKVLVTRARDLLKLYCLILPTVGFSLFTAPRIDFYMVLWDRLVPSGMFLATGVLDGAAITTILVMGVIQFTVIPLVEWMGLKIRFLGRFFIGYVCAVVCIMYTTGILQSLEEVTPTPSTGMVRIFNARHDPVRLVSLDQSISSFDRVAKPRDEVVLTLDVSLETLFKVRIAFTETNITTYLSVQPDVTIGYLLLEPARVVRMGDKLPIRELAAGKTNPRLPKLYIFNALATTVTVELRASEVGEFRVVPGEFAVSQFPGGTYHLRTLEFESNGANNITLEAGGFYGIIAHENNLEPLLTTDTLILKSRLDTIYILGVCIPYGAALVLSYVTLRGMIFVNTPEGMEGLSFGFLHFLHDMTFWFIWIGHQTWHPFITSYSLRIYSVIEVVMMFCCIFVFIKFGDWYKFQ